MIKNHTNLDIVSYRREDENPCYRDNGSFQ